jgi:hypothetical protein
MMLRRFLAYTMLLPSTPINEKYKWFFHHPDDLWIHEPYTRFYGF